MASRSSYIKHRPFLTRAFYWGTRLGASPPKRHGLGMCSPGQGRSQRSVLYWVTCYFYLMPAFSGRIRSREQTEVSIFGARPLRVLPPPSSDLLLFFFHQIAQDHRASPKRGLRRAFLIFLGRFKSSLLRRQRLLKGIMQMGKKMSLCFIRQDPRNGRAAGNTCCICS